MAGQHRWDVKIEPLGNEPCITVYIYLSGGEAAVAYFDLAQAKEFLNCFRAKLGELGTLKTRNLN